MQWQFIVSKVPDRLQRFRDVGQCFLIEFRNFELKISWQRVLVRTFSLQKNGKQIKKQCLTKRARWILLKLIQGQMHMHRPPSNFSKPEPRRTWWRKSTPCPGNDHNRFSVFQHLFPHSTDGFWLCSNSAPTRRTRDDPNWCAKLKKTLYCVSTTTTSDKCQCSW